MMKMGVKMEFRNYDPKACKPEDFIGKPVKVEDKTIGEITEVEFDRSRGYLIVYLIFEVVNVGEFKWWN